MVKAQGSETPLQIDVSWDGTEATVTLAGELDLTNAPGLSERLGKVTAAHPKRLVLDVSGLVFMDVAGARALDRAFQALDSGCPVIFRGFRPAARRVFRLTGFMRDRHEEISPA